MKTVWVNGVFDIVHLGHIKLFEYAKSQGDYLIVGIDCDKRVKELKGPDRPINNEEDRKEFLKAIKYIDEVRIFDSEEQLEYILHHLSPDIMIVGSEYKIKRVIGSQYAKQLFFFDKFEDYSSSNILKKI